jgi:hypothetical protein
MGEKAKGLKESLSPISDMKSLVAQVFNLCSAG